MAENTCDTLGVPVIMRRGRWAHERDGTPCYGTAGHIVQIIPAPVGMLACFKDDDVAGGVVHVPVACLALVEDCAGDRYVEGLDLTSDTGLAEPCSSAKNFMYYQFADQLEDRDAHARG